jgi:hypothetical protein
MANSKVERISFVKVSLLPEEALFIKLACQNSKNDEYDALRKSIFDGLPSIKKLQELVNND